MIHRIVIFSLASVLSLASCEHFAPGNKEQFVDPFAEYADAASKATKPIIMTSLKDAALPELFEAAFHDSTTVMQEGYKYYFVKDDIGNLLVKSGKISAFDPLIFDGDSPFTQNFPIGEFPVQVAMASTVENEAGRVAMARIVFSDEKVVKWEFTLKPGQESIPLKDTSYYCYGVDTGTGAFIDSVSDAELSRKYEINKSSFILEALEKHSYGGLMIDFSGHNIATFPTGYGDGCYSTYIGFDKNSKPCQLLTDFAMIAWWNLENSNSNK